MKLCLKCKVEKELNLFTKDKNRKDGYTSLCKICRRGGRAEEHKRYYIKNKEKISVNLALYRQKNALKRKETVERSKQKRINLNKELLKRNLFVYPNTKICGKCRIEKEAHNFCKSNRLTDGLNCYCRSCETNKRKGQRARSLNNQITDVVRSRLNNALRGLTKKPVSAVRDLGCTISQLKDWLERQFDNEMTWENRGKGPGKWNIDHVYPLSLVDKTKRELLLPLVHYTNLQPMWFEENQTKHNNLI